MFISKISLLIVLSHVQTEMVVLLLTNEDTDPFVWVIIHPNKYSMVHIIILNLLSEESVSGESRGRVSL